MFDLSKIFDLSKKFALPDTLLKSSQQGNDSKPSIVVLAF
jgi:hypothetical protein